MIISHHWVGQWGRFTPILSSLPLFDYLQLSYFSYLISFPSRAHGRLHSHATECKQMMNQLVSTDLFLRCSFFFFTFRHHLSNWLFHSICRFFPLRWRDPCTHWYCGSSLAVFQLFPSIFHRLQLMDLKVILKCEKNA